MTRPIRVLVADDEMKLRELMVRELSRKGHEVEGVGDGESALGALREREYDVVVLDMKMPRKEGIEVLRDLQSFPEHPQVVVMTGFQEVATAVAPTITSPSRRRSKSSTSSSARRPRRGS
jgi:DNA-binding NtrC family response regulator